MEHALSRSVLSRWVGSFRSGGHPQDPSSIVLYSFGHVCQLPTSTNPLLDWAGKLYSCVGMNQPYVAFPLDDTALDRDFYFLFARLHQPCQVDFAIS
jgi:hypothetical protein